MGMMDQQQGTKLRTNMSAPEAKPAPGYLDALAQAANQAATSASKNGVTATMASNIGYGQLPKTPPIPPLPALPPDLADQVNQNAVASERQRQLARKGRAASFLSDSYAPTSLPPMSTLGK